ncbi:F-box protein At4g18380-like [Cornus florida]|uniref:F-box protein At4g18380-like n=1 Tax=Cornus florida TaxID=4283 RepID=UPI00289E2145|nr:F-box protein At4g18380-like [Cornus florida]
MRYSLSTLIIPFLASSITYQKKVTLFDFLKYNTSGNCFEFSLPCHKNNRFVKWEAEFGAKLDNVVILSSASLHKLEEEPQNLTIKRTMKSIFRSVLDCLELAALRHSMLRMVVSELAPFNQKLQKVLVTDLEREGNVCVRGDHLAQLINSKIMYTECSTLGSLHVPKYAKLWYVPLLRLSSSGYVMKEVSVVLIKRTEVRKKFKGVDARILANGEKRTKVGKNFKGVDDARILASVGENMYLFEDGDDKDDINLVLSAFEDEERVYGEAVRDFEK